MLFFHLSETREVNGVSYNIRVIKFFPQLSSVWECYFDSNDLHPCRTCWLFIS